LRIAIDIDSTLHHYWDLLAEVARRRFGVDLPYEEQRTWGITTLPDEDVLACVMETHGEEIIARGEPYPGAVEVVRDWHEAGHFIHITSHRTPSSHDPTARWLEAIGLPFDDLRCGYEKVDHCVGLGIDVLIDDSPVNIARAIDTGITAATIRHPWNADVCEEEDVICADDWLELERRLQPLLDGDRRPA
jgi:FMN phosphatase YigB (HAD superfamily)